MNYAFYRIKKEPNSCLIGRRLLGNYNLVNELANAGFHTQTESDSTLFYSETIVGRKQ